MGFYDCHNKFEAFAYVSEKGTIWKQEIYIYGQHPNYHKFNCSAFCMKFNEEIQGHISELLVGQTNVREARKIQTASE